MAGVKDPDGCTVDRIVNPWNNPKLTIGEACDIRIQEARQAVEKLCIQKAKLEAIDWLKLPYHATRNLTNMEGYPF
jgi:hypothetical protein